MMILYFITLIIVLLYAIMIAAFTYAWIKAPVVECSDLQIKAEELLSFSVLIPFRNEEKNIRRILSDLEAQSYPNSQFEVVLIDDESNDNSLAVVKDYMSSSKLDYKIIQSAGGKKKAIEKGLKRASNDFIVSLDADVRVGKDLLHCYAMSFSKNKAKLFAAPVVFNDKHGILSKVFSLEFISLIVSGAAAINLGKPIMLNAANMAFERSIAMEFLEEVYQSNLPSGDDQFLMESIERKYGASSIQFMKSPQAFATTAAPESLSAFFNQRVRWASKTSSYTSRFSQLIAVLVFLFNLLVVGSLALAIIQQSAFIFLIIYALKILIDLPILLSASIFFKQEQNMFYYLLLQFIYPWYIVVVAIGSLFGSYTWKGRKYH